MAATTTARTTAAPPVGTARSRALAAFSLAAIATAASGCGGSGHPGAARRTTTATSAISEAQPSGPGSFSWLKPRAAPSTWRAQSIPDGAVLHYPPGWQLARGDPGTATAVLIDRQGRIVGYLNATPREDGESLATWPEFRVRHNSGDGDRQVRTEATAQGLAFESGRGSCVRDSYTTTTNARYVEIACLVAGRKATTIVVAAASADHWPQLAGDLERAVSAFAT